VLTVMSNVLVVLPAGPIRPYGLAGIGLIRPHAQLDPASLTTDKNALGYDIGGGVNVSVAPHVAVRGDLRHLHTFSDVTLSLFSGQALDFWRASAGLTLRF
jgi:opacity protein-like surface antigen